MLAGVEDKCQAGLSSHASGLLFASDGEPKADEFVNCLRAAEETMIKHGLEPVFHVITKDGTKINMFHSPGLVTPDVLSEWITDLRTDGVWDHTNPSNATRLAVCPTDDTNLDWSKDALLNSCTEGLKQQIKDSLKGKD